MAGSDQSVNLGGMLSGIGNTLGQQGQGYADSLGRNIENMSRPDVDPTDIGSMTKLMGWQNNMGRTQEAALTQSSIKTLEAKRKENLKIEQGQARAKVIADLDAATMAGDEAAMETARTAALDLGIIQGIDLTGAVNSVEESAARRTNQAFAEQQRAIQAQEDAEAAKVTEMVGQAAATMNAATTHADLEAALAAVPEEAAEKATLIFNRNTDRLTSKLKRQAAEAELTAPVATVSDTILPDSSLMPEAVSKRYRDRLKAINTRLEAINKKAKNGTLEKTERTEVLKSRSNFERDMEKLSDTLFIQQSAEEDRKERELQKALLAADKRVYPKHAVERFVEDNPDYNVNDVMWWDTQATGSQATAALRAEEKARIYEQFGATPPPSGDLTAAPKEWLDSGMTEDQWLAKPEEYRKEFLGTD
jgi:hypothetical protein